jgi:hypothetical protein
VLLLTDTEAWSGAALGLTARARLADRWRVDIDAAVLPFVGMWAVVNHWLRPIVDPFVGQGHGWGSQVEAIISYALTDEWSVGAGARYWYFATSNAEMNPPSALNHAPQKFYNERYGGFLQASYKFGAPSSAASSAYRASSAPITWTGPYVGGNLGAGFGRSAWADPFGPVPVGDQDRVGVRLRAGKWGRTIRPA